MPIKHDFVSSAPPSSDPDKVGSTEWNANHDISGLTLDEIGEGSTNKAFTSTLKSKLDGIEAGAQANDAETDPIFLASEAHNFTAGDKSKLDGIEAGAEVNNISDVNATDLTDGGSTTLHSHTLDSANFTGTNWTDLTDGGATTLHTHAGGSSFQFPVGYVYISVDATNPNSVLGYGTWSSFAAGRVLVGLDSGDANFDTVEETGGAKTVTSAGTNSAPSFTGDALATHTHGVTSNVAVSDHSAHTHSYSEIVQHTHTITITDSGHTHNQGIRNTGTAGTVGVQGASTANNATITNGVPSATTGITASSANPAGSVASGTTGNPSATLTHSVTNNAVTSAATSGGTPSGSVSAPTYTGSATSVVQPYIVVYMFKRTS